jgi:hypothetical protein
LSKTRLNFQLQNMIFLQSPQTGGGSFQLIILIAIILFFIRRRSNYRKKNHYNNEVSNEKNNSFFRMCPFCFNLTLRSRKRCVNCWYKIN